METTQILLTFTLHRQRFVTFLLLNSNLQGVFFRSEIVEATMRCVDANYRTKAERQSFTLHIALNMGYESVN